MSVCRFGEPCWSGMPLHDCDLACNPCPGSSVYVYWTHKDALECCGCSISSGHFTATTVDEMFAHLLAHEAAGDHVRRSLLAMARGETPSVSARQPSLADYIAMFPRMMINIPQKNEG